MGEDGLGTLRMVLRRADAAAVGHPDDHRDAFLAQGAVVQLRDLGDDLVVGREDEGVELDLDDRAVAADGHADRGADDAGLGQRGIDDSLRTEVLLQTFGDAEDTAELADVLADEDDLRVVLHGLAHSGGDRLREGKLLHQASPASANEAWYARNPARSSSTREWGSEVTWANISTPSGSSIDMQLWRIRAARVSASASTSAKKSSLVSVCLSR